MRQAQNNVIFRFGLLEQQKTCKKISFNSSCLLHVVVPVVCVKPLFGDDFETVRSHMESGLWGFRYRSTLNCRLHRGEKHISHGQSDQRQQSVTMNKYDKILSSFCKVTDNCAVFQLQECLFLSIFYSLIYS